MEVKIRAYSFFKVRVISEIVLFFLHKLQVGSKVTGTIDARTCESLKNEGFAGVKIGDTTFGWNNLPQNEDFSLEFTAGGYLGVGGEVSVNINLSELWRRVVKFFGD
jgi:hypothetical protein